MASYSAKDVAALRQMTGAGMLDCKNALEETGGDMEEAAKLLRMKGLAGAAKRSDREASEGAVAVARSGDAAAVVELRCETDFVAKAEEFVALADELAALVAAKGEDATEELADEIDRLRATLKENISVGRVRRLVAESGQVLDTYLHRQAGRGVNAVAVVLEGGSEELAHEIAVHIAFTKPAYLSRDEVPEADAAAERATLEEISRNEGKPEAALGKIVEGRMNGWYKERVLLDQAYVRDEKQTITGMLGTARSRVVRAGLLRRLSTGPWEKHAGSSSRCRGRPSPPLRPTRPSMPRPSSAWPRKWRAPWTVAGSSWPSWWAVATSGVARPGRAAVWTARPPTPWGCSER